MVLTDGVHLIGSDEKELHAFAQKIGLKHEWFQGDHRIPHYDILSKEILHRAIANGAIGYKTRTLVGIYKDCFRKKKK